MNGDVIRFRGLVAIAVGAGVMIGAASVYLCQQFFCERKRELMQQDIDELGVSVADIRRELSALRGNQLRNRSSRQAVGAPSIVTDAETEMFSTVGTEDVDDEFYDFSSDNETVLEEARDSSFEEIDVLLEGRTREDKTKAYGILLELLEKDRGNEEVLWRLSKACHMMGTLYAAEGNNDKKKEFIFKGVEFGQRAVEINNGNWRSHKWLAICVGGRGQLQSVKEKLRDGRMFKEHLDTAIAINPDDPTLHHLLGRFNYEVAGLSWLERKVAGTLFGQVPSGSYKGAVNSLMEVERLNPTAWKENRLLISKCYIAQQDHKKALKWLDSAKEVPALSPEDQMFNKEIESLLKKYNSYRESKT